MAAIIVQHILSICLYFNWLNLEILNIEKIFVTESNVTASSTLKREVKYDIYYSQHTNFKLDSVELLLVNDGQDLVKMDFKSILKNTDSIVSLKPILVVGIHCGNDRIEEYGTGDVLDYKGRGTKANAYRRFVMEELIPQLQVKFKIKNFHTISFAGFSLGGLSAMDIAWKYPKIFTKVGVFSGALWWRTVDLNDGYKENEHKIMHQLVRKGKYQPHMKFFFEVGHLDETSDRNKNGIIDAIDDTKELIDELVVKGYAVNKDIEYLELPDGRHNVETWAKAFPSFLIWGWKK